MKYYCQIKKEKLQKAKTEKETILKELIGNKGDISSEKTIMDIPSQSNLKIQQEKYQLYKNGIKLRGKSGGARIITCVRVTAEKIYLISIYDKSEKEDISDKELNELLKLI